MENWKIEDRICEIGKWKIRKMNKSHGFRLLKKGGAEETALKKYINEY